MRTFYSRFLAIVAMASAVAGCTVKDVDQPAFAGPSTFAYSIVMRADRDSLLQNGADSTTISVTATGPDGKSEAIRVRAQVFVDGTAQDFGTLSTKDTITPATIRYTAPGASHLATSQVPTTVTILVTPYGCAPSTPNCPFTDARGEIGRQVDIELVPQGVILPTNPSLVAGFTFTPANPQSFQIVSFDATNSTNSGGSCGNQCTYAWDFGDGTTGTGQTTTHQFRTVSAFQVRLTVTDARGAQATSTQTVTTITPTPPTVSFTISPTPAPTNIDVFFNASASRPATGRTLVSYNWNFGDSETGNGVTVTHRYRGVGSYTVTLAVTDDAGAVGQSTQTLSVGTTASQATASLTLVPSSPKPGQRVVLDASASTPSTGAVITNYKFDYGDGSPLEDSTNPVQSHTYAAGNFVAAVQITDSNGKTSTRAVSFTVQP